MKTVFRNFDGMVILARFPANFPKFQIFLEQAIFVVYKSLVYKKAFICNEEFDKIKIKRFA